MTDHELEQRLRAWYRDEVGYTEPAPTALYGALPQITEAGRAGLFGTWSLFPAPRVMVLLAVVLLTMLAYGLWLIFAQPRPLPTPLPPPEVNLWMVIQNERLTPVDYSLEGGDAGGGGVGACAVGLSSDVMTAPWSIEMDGRIILTSDEGAAAYAGLASGGDVTIRVRAPQDGELQVSTLEAGSGLGADQGTPAACAASVEPAPGVEVPPDFSGPWRGRVAPGGPIEEGVYQFYLLQAAVEHFGLEGHGGAQYIQGPIAKLTDGQIAFGSSPTCANSGSYQWQMTEARSTLTFTPIDDDCAERLALFGHSLERYPDMVLLGGVRYVARDFRPDIAFTVPPEMAFSPDQGPGYNAVRSSDYHYFRIPGLGWEIGSIGNTTPAACNGPEDWLTGGGADNNNYEVPEDIASLAAFRAAFAAWDAGHEDVSVTQPRDLTISGRPATSVDVIAGATCATEPGLGPGDVLERDFAIDLGDRVLIIATGPGVFEADALVEPDTHQAQTYDPSLLDVGERFARSLELL